MVDLPTVGDRRSGIGTGDVLLRRQPAAGLARRRTRRRDRDRAGCAAGSGSGRVPGGRRIRRRAERGVRVHHRRGTLPVSRGTLRRLHETLVPPDSGQGWTAYLWLVYLGFFFIEWIFRPIGPIEATLGALSIAAFLVLYFSAFRRRGKAALLHIAGIAGLALAWAPFNAGSSVLFIYAASFAHQVGRPRRAALVVAGIALLAATVALWAQPVLHYWLPGVFVSIVIGAANIFFGEQNR